MNEDPDPDPGYPTSEEETVLSSRLTVETLVSAAPADAPSNGHDTENNSPAFADSTDPVLHLFRVFQKRPVTNAKEIKKYFNMYYFHLRSEYYSLPKEIRNKDNEIVARVTNLANQDSVDWYDIFDLETIILELQPLSILKRRAWVLREKYRQIVPTEIYQAYKDSKPPDIDSIDETSEAILRADLLKILKEFHWLYSVTIIKEEIRGSILNKLALALFLVIIISLGYVSLPLIQTFAWIRETPAILTVLIVGILGGIVSTLFRLFNSQTIGSEPVKDIVQLHQGRISIYVSPILGGVFAVVLFVILSSGFLEGSISPALTTSETAGQNAPLMFFDYWTKTGPATAKDASILLIWSFLAGFAERLVPDVLDRIAKTRDAKFA